MAMISFEKFKSLCNEIFGNDALIEIVPELQAYRVTWMFCGTIYSMEIDYMR